MYHTTWVLGELGILKFFLWRINTVDDYFCNSGMLSYSTICIVEPFQGTLLLADSLPIHPCPNSALASCIAGVFALTLRPLEKSDFEPYSSP